MEKMRKKSRKWTNEETEALRAGVEKHGFGKWTAILSDSQFASSFDNRSNIDLKDKWRNLTRICCWSNRKKKVRNPMLGVRASPSLKEDRDKPRGGKEVSVGEARVVSICLLPSGFSDTQKQKGRCNVMQHSSKKRRKKVVEELSEPKHYHNPCTVTRQRRGTRNNKGNQSRKLNSEEFHIHLENLWLSFPEDKRSSFTHLDPLWYALYSRDSNKARVLSWIKKKNIFSRNYVVFPIVEWGHWFVLIFCHFGESFGSKVKTPCILLLDSLAKADHSKKLEPVIRKFVLDIYNNLKRTEDTSLVRKMPFLVPKVPQQRDNEECGFLVLYYIKLFVESAPESFSTTNGYPYFMKKDWFDFEGLDSFCKTL